MRWKFCLVEDVLITRSFLVWCPCWTMKDSCCGWTWIISFLCSVGKICVSSKWWGGLVGSFFLAPYTSSSGALVITGGSGSAEFQIRYNGLSSSTYQLPLHKSADNLLSVLDPFYARHPKSNHPHCTILRRRHYYLPDSVKPRSLISSFLVLIYLWLLFTLSLAIYFVSFKLRDRHIWTGSGYLCLAT